MDRSFERQLEPGSGVLPRRVDEFVGVAVEQTGERDEGEGGVVVTFDGAEDGDGLLGVDILTFQEEAVAVADGALEGKKVVDVGGGKGHGRK